MSRSAGGTVRLLLAAALVVAGSGPAAAALRTIEQAYELTRSEVKLPTSADGGLTVQPCPTCRPVVLRVSAATLWYRSPVARQDAGQSVDQAQFLAAWRASTDPRTLVYVYYEPRTRRVKRVVLDDRGAGAAP